MSTYPTGDWLTAAGALTLAGKIRRYWQARGFDVEPFVEEFKVTDRGTVYGVRSDMVAGLPCGFVAPRKKYHQTIAAGIEKDARHAAVGIPSFLGYPTIAGA